ncbi:MAG: NAD(+) synthase [Cytophagales bacterium]|nr:NAD(+) synthase [Cytophagales bacterium]
MSFQLGLASLNQTPLDWKGNLSRILKALQWGRAQQVSLLATQELSLTGYGCEDFFKAAWVYEKSFHILETEILPQTKGIALSIGLPLLWNNKAYNALCLMHNQHIMGFYVKQTLAKEGVYYEPRWFHAWEKEKIQTLSRGRKKYPIGEILFEIHDTRIGFEICEDAWQSCRPLARYAQKGVQYVINTSASHFEMGKYEEKKRLIQQSAQRYKVPYAYVNALGNEAGKLVYEGDRWIAYPNGRIQEEQRFSSQDVAHMLVLSKESRKSKIQIPLSIYEECTQALSLALHDYHQKSEVKGGFVLSLSGGSDSAMCAVLVSEMRRRYRPQKSIQSLLLSLYQGTENSSAQTAHQARKLAEEIGNTHITWSVQEEVLSYKKKVEELIRRKLSWEKDSLALENLQARSRVAGLWLLANLRDALLLNTGNRSELSMGYITTDGDMAGSLAPLGGLSKAFIQNYLRWAEEELGYKSLREIRKYPPTAELLPPRFQQQDEKELMPYQTLEKIEELFFLNKKSPSEIERELFGEQEKKIYLPRFLANFRKSQWKRERMAAAFSMDKFNIDPKTWGRYPILMGKIDESYS